MLIALPLTVGVVAALVWRHADGPGNRRELWLVGGLALAVRLVACLVIFLIARQAHDSGEWLNDESAFFKATSSLMPNPLDRQIQEGLEHLAGDGYLGLTTMLAMAGGGVADTNAFRVVNAALGACVVVLGMIIARRLFGARAGLVAGLALAVWPTLVLWSATMLRDMLGSFVVVTMWWTISRARDLGWPRVLGVLFLTLVIAFSLRPYLGGAIASGTIAWAAYPWLRQLGWRKALALAAGMATLVVTIGVLQARQLDYAMHELVYRRTMTRMETLGRLYTDYPPLRPDLPIRPGAAVGMVQADSGRVLGGVVQDFQEPDLARVAFTDESIREVPMSELIPLQSTDIQIAQIAASMVPDLVSYLVGISQTSEAGSTAWIAEALAWDVVLVLAVVAVAGRRLGRHEWLYPLCVVASTVLALVAISGAPGNADRHRATQTLPFVLVLASGLLSAPSVSGRRAGLAVTSITTSPPSAAAAASSRIRSAR